MHVPRFAHTALRRWRLGCVLVCLWAAGCSMSWLNAEPRLTSAINRLTVAAAKPVTETPAPKSPTPAPKGDVPMSMLDALALTLKNNPDIQIAGYDPMLAQEDVIKAEAVFDPAVFAKNTFARTDRPIQSLLDTGNVETSALTEDRWAGTGGVRQRSYTGGTMSVYQEMDYLNTNSRFTFPNPQYTSRLNAELEQPFLKGFGDPVNRAAIRVANLNQDISLQDFRQKVMEVASQTIASYWQLAFEREMAKVDRDSVELAREVLRREEVRQGQGMSNELNTARAMSALATRQADLIRAEGRIRNSVDRLLRFLSSRDLPLDSDLVVIPTESPRFFLVDVDRTASMTRALTRRPEMERIRTAIAANQIRLGAADRERLPKLDAVLRYTMNGVGADMGNSVEMQEIGDLASWTAGFEFELPLGNRAADSDFRRRRVEYEQSLLKAEQLADQVMQEVSVAARAVLQGRDEVESTLRAQTAAEKVVSAEFARYELGEVSNDELLRSQDILSAARRDHLQALLNFNLALAELTRAQGTLMEDHGIDVIWPQKEGRRPLPVGVVLPGRKDQPPAEAKPAAKPASDAKAAPALKVDAKPTRR